VVTEPDTARQGDAAATRLINRRCKTAQSCTCGPLLRRRGHHRSGHRPEVGGRGVHAAFDRKRASRSTRLIRRCPSKCPGTQILPAKDGRLPVLGTGENSTPSLCRDLPARRPVHGRLAGPRGAWTPWRGDHRNRLRTGELVHWCTTGRQHDPPTASGLVRRAGSARPQTEGGRAVTPLPVATSRGGHPNPARPHPGGGRRGRSRGPPFVRTGTDGQAIAWTLV